VVHLDASKQFPFEFQIHPSRIFILDSDYVDISASGKLNLSGTTKKSKLQGELTVDQASVHLEEALPRQIKNIEIKYFNIAQNHSLPQYVEKHEANSPVELEVKLHTLQNIRIEGNHLKSEWKGSLAVTGTPENPQLNGDLRIAQGEYDFNGKVFTLTQGNIHFAGAPDKKTSLYIVASKDIDRIKAEIIVKGPANKPAISFRSNPPLSQREVLSYILFNRGISDITPDQGDQLSQSFISLNSNDQTKNSDDFLSRLRNNIGIDRLDFIANDNKENRDFGLQVGKHLTENVTVSVNQSVTSLSPIIAVEAQLRKNIKAQAEAGVAEDAPIRMSIKWKKDY
jgi:translocation and assembly module TamB